MSETTKPIENKKCCWFFENSSSTCPFKATNDDFCPIHYNLLKDKCIWKLEDGKLCLCTATNDRFCLTHYNLNIQLKGKEEFDKLGELIENKACTSAAHFKHDSPYPKEKVPIKEFMKEMKGGKVKIFDTCSHCRYKRTNSRIRKKTERKEENLKQSDPNFRTCISECHEAEDMSIFPRNKVPFELFLGRTIGKIYDNCLDCRKHVNQIGEKTRENRKNNAEEDEYVCNHCGKKGDENLRAVNLDGTPSSRCTFCKESEIKFNASQREKTKEILKQLKLEMIKKNGSCCEKCNSIFLISNDDNKPFIELKVFVENDKKFVTYLSETYDVQDFFEKFEDLLELRMLEFDHLNEKEQRERNIIRSDENFIKKKDNVSHLRTEWGIREEAKITQILCCICHLKETIFREKGICLHGMAKIKHDYVDKIKIEKGGCEKCGFFDINFLRYLEFDHINPEEKIRNICDMINQGIYSLEDIIEECKKCRLLCKMCHKLRTDKQIKDGVFDNAYRNYPIINYYPLV